MKNFVLIFGLLAIFSLTALGPCEALDSLKEPSLLDLKPLQKFNGPIGSDVILGELSHDSTTTTPTQPETTVFQQQPQSIKLSEAPAPQKSIEKSAIWNVYDSTGHDHHHDERRHRRHGRGPCGHRSRSCFCPSSSSSSSCYATSDYTPPCSSSSSSFECPCLPCPPSSCTSSETPSCSSSSSSSSCSSSSSSSHCCKSESGCDVQCVITYKDYFDFRTSYPSVPDFAYFTSDSYVANDGDLVITPHGGIVDSRSFNLTTGKSNFPLLDNFKYYFLKAVQVALPRFGNFYVNTAIGAKVYNITNSPFPKEVLSKNDVRLASAGMLTYDVTTGLFFGFLLTDDRIYALYQRIRPNVSEATAAFAYIIPVACRESCDVHNVSIVFNSITQYVDFRIEGKTVYTIKDVGKPLTSKRYAVWLLNGTETSAFPDSIAYGIGTFGGLGYYPACRHVHEKHKCPSYEFYRRCDYPTVQEGLVDNAFLFDPIQYNPILGFPYVADFFDDASLESNRLWGQGALLNIQQMVVYSESCYALNKK